MAQPGAVKSNNSLLPGHNGETDKVKLKAFTVVLTDIFRCHCSSGTTTNNLQQVSGFTAGREVNQKGICGQVKQEDTDREVMKDIDREVMKDIGSEVTKDIDRDVTSDNDREITRDIDREVTQDIERKVTQDIEREVIKNIDRGVTQEDREVTHDISTDVAQKHIDRDVTQDDIVREVTQSIERYVTKDITRDFKQDDSDSEVAHDISRKVTYWDIGGEVKGEDTTVLTVKSHDTTDCTCSKREDGAKVNKTEQVVGSRARREEAADEASMRDVVVQTHYTTQPYSMSDSEVQTHSTIQPDAVRSNNSLLPGHNRETHKVKLKACTVVLTDMYNCDWYQCAEQINEPVGSDTANNLYSSRRRCTGTRVQRVVILATRKDVVGDETTKFTVKLCDIEDCSHVDDTTMASVSSDTEMSPHKVSSVTHDDMSRENITEVTSKSRDTRDLSESDDASEGMNEIQDPDLTDIDADKCEEKASSWSTVEIRASSNEQNVNTDRSFHTCDKQRRNGRRGNHIKPHTCHICGVSFRKKFSLTRHVDLHTGVKSHACPVCDKVFSRRYNMIHHKLKHSHVEAYKGRTCSKTFARLGQLKSHRKYHTSRPTVTWTGDDVNVSAVTLDDTGGETTALTIQLRAARDVSYTDFSDVDASIVAEKSTCHFPRSATHDTDVDRRHSKCDQSTHRDRPLQCDTCDKSFGSTYNLNRHRRNRVCQKEKVTAYPCGICGKVFDNKRTRTQHDRNHSTLQRYSCEACGKICRSWSGIEYHRLVHKGDRCHLCDTCGKTFLSRSCLTIHKRLHLAELRYPCPTCDKSFYYLRLLKQHENMHAGVRPFVCVTCDKSFSGANHLRRHKNTVHASSKPALCETCGRAFINRERLTIHMRLHSDERPYGCKICGASFKQPFALTVHNRIHTKEKPYVCKICGKTFVTLSQIRTHEKSHTGAKPHACTVCGKTFTLPHHRRAHEKTHARDATK